MAYDKNQCIISGKVSDIRQINTKTGNSMSSFRLMCWREQIRCVGFGEVASDMLSFNDGDRVLLTGKIQSSNWEKEGVKVYSYQVILETVHPDTQEAAGCNSKQPDKLSMHHRKRTDLTRRSLLHGKPMTVISTTCHPTRLFRKT